MKYLAFIPGDYFGGCEDYAFRIANAAIQRGWSIDLLLSNPALYTKAKEYVPAATLHLIAGAFGPEFNGPRAIKSFLDLYRLKSKYQKLLRHLEPSVIHAILPWHYHSIFFLEVCSSLGLAIVVTYQLVAPNRDPHWRQKRIMRNIYSSKRLTVTAISNNNRDLLSFYYEIPLAEIPVIPNRPRSTLPTILHSESARMHLRNSLLHELGIPRDATISTTVAALHYQKGIDLLLRGAERLSLLFPKLYFVIAGDGSSRAQYEALAKSLNLQNRVRFLGRRDDVESILTVSDFFLFPTRYEGESFALLEAARSHLPIIASNASGIPESFRDGIDALLFEVEDYQGMCDQVSRLLNDKSLAKFIAANAFESVSSFTEDDMFNSTLDLLVSKAQNI